MKGWAVGVDLDGDVVVLRENPCCDTFDVWCWVEREGKKGYQYRWNAVPPKIVEIAELMAKELFSD